jgi:hypothetical protein
MDDPIVALRITADDFEERDNGIYWLGPLDIAKQIVSRDRFVFEGFEPHDHGGGQFYRVRLCDDPEGLYEAEWGSSAKGDPEEAWRYALGAAIGPYDYDEDETLIGVGYRTHIIQEPPV